ncbi:unnamed protein product [Timema podura]|uniref:RRM domain-containing protein n=1 Tax=Timema podura TaxID=61482 RepID=A0ABN7NR87_TIMPD|nr:unnamed protein product [Timema podura]
MIAGCLTIMHLPISYSLASTLHKIDPKPCNPRSLQKPKRSNSFPKVFLGGLPSNVTETDLRTYFTRFGKVMEVVIMYDQEKKKSRGFGFLSFELDEAVDRCVAEHFVNLNGKQAHRYFIISNQSFTVLITYAKPVANSADSPVLKKDTALALVFDNNCADK